MVADHVEQVANSRIIDDYVGQRPRPRLVIQQHDSLFRGMKKTISAESVFFIKRKERERKLFLSLQR